MQMFIWRAHFTILARRFMKLLFTNFATASRYPAALIHTLINQCCGVPGREIELQPSNYKVACSFPGKGVNSLVFIAHNFDSNTGVVPRKQNRQRLVSVVRTCFSIVVK